MRALFVVTALCLLQVGGCGSPSKNSALSNSSSKQDVPAEATSAGPAGAATQVPNKEAQSTALESRLIGVWREPQRGFQMEFLQGGTAITPQRSGRWEISGDRIIITYSAMGTSVAATGRFQGGDLLVTDPEGTYRLQKQ